MLTLFRSVCNHDWKGKPSNSLNAVGTGTREELLALQDADVERWQAEDIANENEAREIDNENEDDISLHAAPITKWEETGAVEMDERRDGLRDFFCKTEDGDYWSIAYHIHES